MTRWVAVLVYLSPSAHAASYREKPIHDHALLHAVLTQRRCTDVFSQILSPNVGADPIHALHQYIKSRGVAPRRQVARQTNLLVVENYASVTNQQSVNQAYGIVEDASYAKCWTDARVVRGEQAVHEALEQMEKQYSQLRQNLRSLVENKYPLMSDANLKQSALGSLWITASGLFCFAHFDLSAWGLFKLFMIAPGFLFFIPMPMRFALTNTLQTQSVQTEHLTYSFINAAKEFMSKTSQARAVHLSLAVPISGYLAANIQNDQVNQRDILFSCELKSARKANEREDALTEQWLHYGVFHPGTELTNPEIQIDLILFRTHEPVLLTYYRIYFNQ